MAGALTAVYAIVAVAAAVLGLLFMIVTAEDREMELLVGGVIGIAVLVGLGASLLL